MWRWLIGSSQGKPEQDEEPVDADEDPYDPAKPEYLIPASAEEVEARELQLLRNQIVCLEDALAKRHGSLDPMVAKHYTSVLGEMYASEHARRLSRHQRCQSAPAGPVGAVEEAAAEERRSAELEGAAAPVEAGGSHLPADWCDKVNGTPTAKAASESASTVETMIIEVESPLSWEIDSEAGDTPREEDESQDCSGFLVDLGCVERSMVDVFPLEALPDPEQGEVHNGSADVAAIPGEEEPFGGYGDLEDTAGMFVGYEGTLGLSNAQAGGESYEGQENVSRNVSRDELPLDEINKGLACDSEKKGLDVNEVTCKANAQGYNEAAYTACKPELEAQAPEAFEKVQAEASDASALWRFWEVLSSVSRLT